MKKNILFAFCAVLLFASCDTKTQDKSQYVADKTDATNDFYDNAKTDSLKGGEIIIAGEIESQKLVRFTGLQEHSIIVKETSIDSSGIKFVGAYKYTGYSLYDILNRIKIIKKNADDFRPITDLYIEVENDKGDKVVISWGELYYPVDCHKIIIATKVMPIIPSKTKDIWPLPTETKLIVGNDLITERNISKPSKITIRSLNKKYTVNRTIDPLYSPDLKFYIEDSLMQDYTELSENTKYANYPNVFYGRGRGFHSLTPFKGVFMKEFLKEHLKTSKKNLQTGMFTIAAVDGYRAAFTFSEIYNRTDQSEVLIIDEKHSKREGKFSLYVPADFFSDRALKAVSEIRFNIND